MTPMRVLMSGELSWLPNKDRILTAQVALEVQSGNTVGVLQGKP